MTYWPLTRFSPRIDIAGGEGVDADARKVDGDDETFPEICRSRMLTIVMLGILDERKDLKIWIGS